MHINIKYFGQIAEITNTEEESLELNGRLVSELLEILNQKYNKLKSIDFQVAQNQELVSIETELTGAEIALLPPFAGG
ncbi:MoaD/ThiS family protein [uncultured Algibacter sp.]|uniref:MoaD/ThiS family protein n=1 Tax=uncultured Algibacter sp. TaxID=298659 RepID=UPI00262827F2|nr:MoaD/ThiS family protein [uncultured Algibacter sp.]